jgi:hypothetical protein
MLPRHINLDPQSRIPSLGSADSSHFSNWKPDSFPGIEPGTRVPLKPQRRLGEISTAPQGHGKLRFSNEKSEELSRKFARGGSEDFGVGVDVGFGGSGGHEGHVVEWGEKDAAV